MKRLISVLLVLLLLCGCTRITPEATLTVTVEAVHENGRGLIPPTAVPLPEGATVLDALTIAAKECDVSVVLAGDTPYRYVAAIDDVVVDGSLSRWLCYVNGQLSQIGIEQEKINDGDTCRFLFVTDFTKN